MNQHHTKGTKGKNDNASAAVKKVYNTSGPPKPTHGGVDLSKGHSKIALPDGYKGSHKQSRNKNLSSSRKSGDGEYKNA